MHDDALAEAGICVSHHWAADEVYSKRMAFEAGSMIGKHSHTYDHASALVSGTARLDINGVVSEVTGPQMLLIEKNKNHTITAVTPVIWHCIHITNDTDPKTVDATLVKG